MMVRVKNGFELDPMNEPSRLPAKAQHTQRTDSSLVPDDAGRLRVGRFRCLNGRDAYIAQISSEQPSL